MTLSARDPESQSERPLMTLGADEVHVWFLTVEQGSANSASEDSSVLSAIEEARGQRFIFEKDRRLFLAAHVLVRSVLSRYAAIRPAEWCFAEDDNGKPHVVGPAGAPSIPFNLSHTQGLAVVAVTKNRDIGVDVELIQGSFGEDLAQTCFTVAERSWIDEGPTSKEKRDRFFDLWTLKEAYLKARGTGLSTPLKEFSIRPDAESSAAIEFTAAIDDDPLQWQFTRHCLTENYRLAVAVRCSAAVRLSTRILDARID